MIVEKNAGSRKIIQHKRAVKQKQAAYAAFEKAVLDLYNQELLTLERLDCLASQYRLLTLDSSGSQLALTRDGKDLCQVCIQLVDPTFSIPLRGSSKDHEEYWEQELKKWEDIVRRRWHWHAYNAAIPRLNPPDNAA
jgi:hypothetical protein